VALHMVTAMPTVTERDLDHPAFAVLWGKSAQRTSGDVLAHLLLAHLLDAAAVAELMWGRFLAPTVRARIDACCEGRGGSLFALLCGWHDIGKASPAFQSKVPELAEQVQRSGLTWRELDRTSQRWHHTLAGGMALRRVLRDAGWNREAVSWVIPLITGHHGTVPSTGLLLPPGPGRGNAQGLGAWEAVQDALVYRVAAELGLDLAGIAPVRTPRRAEQLAISGAMVMADWISSDEKHFGGIDSPAGICMAHARERAERAWSRLGLRGGWAATDLIGPGDGDPVKRRFGVESRPSQVDAVAVAEAMPAPGLLIVEAPMGEGKTEAALVVAEVLARRFGADGVFVGMPTQATSDPMFSRVRRWVDSVDPGLPVGLLHGKREFNPEWRALRRQVSYTGVDEYDCDDLYGSGAWGRGSSNDQREQRAGDIPAEWFLGRKRGLLVPVTVGTVDQLLHAATRTRHVMLRHAGLAGRVVVLDEVHAYDVYMSQFLFEALRWLADAGVPVILLSATLPPGTRQDLVRAYLQGALAARDVDLGALPSIEGYPSVLSACVHDGEAVFDVRTAEQWRPSVPVRIETLDEEPKDGPHMVVDLLREALRDGGCALVIRNTVTRAQQMYTAAQEAFGDDVVLLHARLTVGERATRTERVLNALGPPNRQKRGREEGAGRPRRLVVVATQLAEQSFDVDVDLLVTDLAPIDLLLQRIGRLHRHARPAFERPGPVRHPRVIVTGAAHREDGTPRFPTGSSLIYGDHLLLRALALVDEVVRDGADGRTGGSTVGGFWSVPSAVPELVHRGYGEEPIVPEQWAEAATEARSKAGDARLEREANARDFLLAGPGALGTPTLAGLHDRATGDLVDDDAVAAVVRDGDPSIEVVLVHRDDVGYRTLDGHSIGVHGEGVADEAVLERVIASAIRLPARPDLTRAALDELRPLPGWGGDAWLRRTRALVLDDAASASLAGHRLTYDPDLGLIDEREAGR
jgi:CRISPR-associated endonuclease/helicase Cas3